MYDRCSYLVIKLYPYFAIPASGFVYFRFGEEGGVNFLPDFGRNFLKFPCKQEAGLRYHGVCTQIIVQGLEPMRFAAAKSFLRPF